VAIFAILRQIFCVPKFLRIL